MREELNCYKIDEQLKNYVCGDVIQEIERKGECVKKKKRRVL